MWPPFVFDLSAAMGGGKWRAFLQVLFACSLSWFMVFIMSSSGHRKPPNKARDVAPNDSLYLRFMTQEEAEPEQDCSSQCEAQSPYAAMLRDYGAFEPDSKVRILSWTQQYGKSQGIPWFPVGEEAFEECDFDPPLRCEYTQDKSLYNTSDAVLFHAFFIKNLPQERIAGQKWVFWEYESPRIVNILQNLQPFKYQFNLTSTYSVTSDVPLPFLRKCVPEEGQLNVDAKPNEDFSAGKDRLVAWFASHCQTPSRREGYVQELQNHVAVDIYGKCGPYKCSVANRTVCLKDVLEKRYKFILAFENSLCREYITESLWEIFDNRLKVVPIVLGGADYSQYLPPGTYIDVRDFNPPATWRSISNTWIAILISTMSIFGDGSSTTVDT
jgi:glycoprotein 3-alpha-L-fucosyltransferase/alpha-1,3-fucosyltransferase